MAISRWVAPAALTAALAVGAFAPAPARAQSYDLTRAIVDIADVVFRGNQPYYRGGDYGQDDRLVMGRDAYGRTVYYRVDQYGRYNTYNNGYNNSYNTRYRTGNPPYGNAYGYYGRQQQQQRVKCNPHGKCKAEYYDPRYDRRGNQPYWDGRRWRDD